MEDFQRCQEAVTVSACLLKVIVSMHLQLLAVELMMLAFVAVHLDMPSVVRVAEQRVGRIDRMPKRKQRALKQFHWAVKLWARNRHWITSTDQADQVKQLLELFEVGSGELTPDWGHLADLWLELMRSRSAELLQKKGRRASMMRLRDLEPDLKSKPIEVEVLLKKLHGVELRRRWEERIVACILGYGSGSSD